MDDIVNYAFKKAVSSHKIPIIKQCLDINVIITNEILIACVKKYGHYLDDRKSVNFTERIELFNTEFNRTNKGYERNFDYKRGIEQSDERDILITKIFDLLLEYIPNNLIFSAELIDICSYIDYYFINKIIKIGRYVHNEKLLFESLYECNLENVEKLLQNNHDIYLESIIIKSIKNSIITIFENLQKLKIDIYPFRPAIINYCKLNTPMINVDIKEILIDYPVFPKIELNTYMLFSCQEIQSELINQPDIFNHILMIYIQLIQKFNDEYITILQNARSCYSFQRR